MSKQSFTTGQVLTAAQVNSLQANDFNQTVSVKTANYTLTAADKGTRIEFNTSGSVTCTVNSGLFDAGDTLVIQNRGAGTATITAGTATVNTSASLALAQYSAGTLYFVSDSAAIFFGGANASSELKFISSTTIGNGVSSVSLNNVFSSTYRNYRVIINWLEATTGTPNVNLRLRVSGTDNSGATAYQPRGWSNVSGTLAGFGTAGSSLFIAKLSGANPITTMDITLPFSAVYTNFVVNAIEGNNNDAWGFQAVHAVATSYDGFTVFPASSTFTGGTIDVYGYGV